MCACVVLCCVVGRRVPLEGDSACVTDARGDRVYLTLDSETQHHKKARVTGFAFQPFSSPFTYTHLLLVCVRFGALRLWQ
jgi:hypothetical protein